MDTTQQEVDNMLASGMIQISSKELNRKLKELGYEISKDLSFCYFNKLNKIHFKAKSIGIIHKESGKSFANIASPKDKLKELQEIRFNNFVFEKGRIWGL